MSDRKRELLFCLILALAMTALNAAKPLVIDDAAFLQYAKQIANTPSDPYGFEIFWYDHPQPAMQVLAPPVGLYWWAGALHLFGDRPLAWKLWLFPFVLLLVFSVRSVAGRVAPGFALPVTCLVLVSPAILPALNLMLDVPALALSMGTLAVSMAAARRPQPGHLVWVAGVLGGLALQTKYTALLPVAAGLLHLCLAGHRRSAIEVGLISAGLFAGFEAWTWLAYGQSHFMTGITTVAAFSQPTPLQWIVAYASLIGASSAALTLLALRSLGMSNLGLASLSALIVAGFAVTGLLPSPAVPDLRGTFEHGVRYGFEARIMCGLGVALGLATALALARGPGASLRAARSWLSASPPPQARALALDAFVVLYVIIELVGLGLLSPFPALRRVIGLHVALCFALGRAGFRAGLPSGSVVAIALVGAGLGLLFAVSDLSDARTRSDAILRLPVIEEVRTKDRAQGWYLGHWSFHYYAEQRGYQPVVPGQTRFRPGDVIAAPRGVTAQRIELRPAMVEPIDVIVGSNPWPWSTLPSAYAGYSPIRPQPEAQLAITLYEVKHGFRASLLRRRE